MNLHLYLRVVRRYWFVVAVGLVLASALAFASLAKASYTHGSLSISYRQHLTWQSTTRLFVTQNGFPWGRSVLPASSSTPGPATGNSASSGVDFADPTRLQGLAVLYAQLINGDLIQRHITKSFPRGDFVGAAPVKDPTTYTVLPLVDVVGRGHSPSEAARVSQAAADLFRSYIADQQASAGVPLDQRVLLQVVSTRTILAVGRKKTLAIVAFLAVMMATVSLTLILENRRLGAYANEPAPERTAPERTGPERTAPERGVVTEHTA